MSAIGPKLPKKDVIWSSTVGDPLRWDEDDHIYRGLKKPDTIVIRRMAPFDFAAVADVDVTHRVDKRPVDIGLPQVDQMLPSIDPRHDDQVLAMKMMLDQSFRINANKFIEAADKCYTINLQPTSSAENPKLLLTIARSST